MTMAMSKEASILHDKSIYRYHDHFDEWLNTYADEIFPIASPNNIITMKSAKALEKMVDEAIEKNEPIKTTPMEFDTIE